MKNSLKKVKKLRERFEKRRELYHLIKKYGNDIMQSDNFKSTRKYIQHGTIPVHRHCLDVAQHSLAINRKLGIHCREKDLVRGALLHDYFLYDWHDKHRKNFQHLHGFYHPGIALRNARKEFQLTPREQDIIKKHMWPLTIVPPRCREAWVVSMADKYCSILETLHIRKGTANRKVNRAEHLRKGYHRNGVQEAC